MAPRPAVNGASEAARENGLALYEMALTDLRGGKKARAHMYAKMAREACPTEPRIAALLDNWHQAEQHARAETDDQRLFAEAQRAEDAGDFLRAIELLRQAIGKNARAAELHNRLGVILAARMGDHTGASSALMRAVELEPHNMVYRSNLGKVFKMSEGKAVGALIADGASVVPTATAAKPVSMLDRLRNTVRR
jgi:tetratricopeptide (TPR) repeat protein